MRYKESIRKEVIEMWELIHSQLTKSLSAIVLFDKDLAREVILIEERVNSSELMIDSDCENFIALKSFSQTDLPFIMIVLKTNMLLERIGDAAVHIANEIIHTKKPYNTRLLESTHLTELFRMVIKIFDLSLSSFENEDSSSGEIVFRRAEAFQEINSTSHPTLKNFIKNNPDQLDQALPIFSIIKNLERVVDQIKDLTKEVINYSDAKVA
ncbi:MAG: phosphate signaling complex PhoU family protein [Flavisolibacter sp.]